MVLFVGLSFASLLSIAMAQAVNDTGNRQPSFKGGSLLIGDLAVLAVFDIVFLVLSALCFRVLLHLHAHLVHTSINIAYTVIGNTTVEFSASATSTEIFAQEAASFAKIVGISSAVEFFRLWAYSSLYLALALVLYDRHKVNMSGMLVRLDKIWFGALFGSFVALFASATAAAWIYATNQHAEKIFFKVERPRQGATQEQLEQINEALIRETTAQLQFQIARYAFYAFWFIASASVAVAALGVDKYAKKVGVYDKITRFMLRVVVPLSIIGMLLGIAFTQLPFLLVSDLLLDVVYAAITVVLLFLSAKREDWALGKGAELLKPGAHPSGDYIDMDAPSFHANKKQAYYK
ncbi:hypothetical protein DFH11DRAFT_1548558 [Phellopilus nigrolimitatus]|nr:hypothetical protein DFH11DRAFT_1548558 [Phellopilus nigrolimitatus]